MSSTLARTQLRYDELFAVIQGQRGRLNHTSGPWLDETGSTLSREQSRALGQLREAGLITTTREGGRAYGKIVVVRTDAGYDAFADWSRPAAERKGDAARGESFLQTTFGSTSKGF